MITITSVTLAAPPFSSADEVDAGPLRFVAVQAFVPGLNPGQGHSGFTSADSYVAGLVAGQGDS